MENEQKQKIRTFPACFAWSWQLNISGRRLLRVTHLLIWTCTMFPCCKCDKLFSSKLALNDHKRKKHNFEVIDLVKVFTCGHCEVSFAKSCNVLRHLKNQGKSSANYQCFSSPTYFGNLWTMTQHQEQYHSDVSLGRPNINVSDLLDFTIEPVNSKFQIHRLELEDSDGLEPFNYIISQKDGIIAFVKSLLSVTPNDKLGLSIAVKLEKPLESEVVKLFSIRLCLGFLLRSPMSSFCRIWIPW